MAGADALARMRHTVHALRELEGRLRSVEEQIRSAAEDHGQGRDPEAPVLVEQVQQITRGRRRDVGELLLSAVTLAIVTVLVTVVLTGGAFYFGIGLVSAFGFVVVDDAISRFRYWRQVERCAACRDELVGEA